MRQSRKLICLLRPVIEVIDTGLSMEREIVYVDFEEAIHKAVRNLHKKLSILLRLKLEAPYLSLWPLSYIIKITAVL